MRVDWGAVWVVFFLVVAVLGLLAEASKAAPTAEVVYSQSWCKAAGGKHQFRVTHPVTGELVGFADCVTDKWAVEVEKERRWYQAVGQSLMYAQYTGLRAKIVLIGKEYGKYHLRLLNMIWNYQLPIEVEVIAP